MKIYISGKITGLDYADVEAKFQDAQDLLSDIGFEVVNPLNNGLTKEHSWEQHMVKDIELLLPCDAIYMMNNWKNSNGASIEYDIAKRMNKYMLYEVYNATANKIQIAIYEVMGISFNQLISRNRKRDYFYARMIFAFHCNNNGINPMEHIPFDRTMLYHYLQKYNDEKKFNPNFRVLAEKVESIVNKTINGKS